MRDFYLCYPAILTNTLVPQPGLSSILQNQLGVALDALTLLHHQVCLSSLSRAMTWNEGFLPGGRFESFLPLVAP